MENNRERISLMGLMGRRLGHNRQIHVLNTTKVY
jgi:hypothetical protein